MLFGDKMIFPKSTIVDKKIPKQRFYDHADITVPLRKKFIDQIERITFSNKFSKETLNIPKTNEVEEIFVFDIILKDNKYLDKIEDVLTVIDKSVPYPILYRFEMGSAVVYKIAHKLRNKNDMNKTVVDIYFTKDNLDIPLEIFNSLNLKILYERILRLFLNGLNEHEYINIEKTIISYKSKESLKKELEVLEKKILKEKQADKQYELHCKIKGLKMEIGKYE